MVTTGRILKPLILAYFTVCLLFRYSGAIVGTIESGHLGKQAPDSRQGHFAQGVGVNIHAKNAHKTLFILEG